MNSLENLLCTLRKFENPEQKLTQEETLLILAEVKRVSSEAQLMDKIIQSLIIAKNQSDNLKKLSKRQNTIFRLVGLGFSTSEIADLLDLSEETVSTHRKNIIKRIGLSGSNQLARFAAQFVMERIKT